MGRINLRRALAVAAIGIAGHQMSCGQETANFTSSNRFHREFLPPKITTQTFSAARIATDKLAYDYEAQTLRQDLALKADQPLHAAMTQEERAVLHDAFTQGNDGDGPMNEDFAVFEAGKLDLLVVVDDSSSMAPYQDRLSKGMQPLLSAISNTDWRMMVTTTSGQGDVVSGRRGCPRLNPDDPADTPLLTKADYDRDADEVNRRYAWKVRAGEGGMSSSERGVYASVMGLSGFCGDGHQAWTRSDSHKAVVILTDEENCGSGSNENCRDLPGEFPQYFTDNEPGVQFFGIINDQVTYPCQDEHWRKPEQYEWLIAKSHGYQGNLCLDNYDATLREISAHIDVVAKTAYELGFTPVPASLHVLLDGAELTDGFVLEGNTVRLTRAVPRTAKTLTVRYKHDPVPRQLRYVLSADAASETVHVAVDGTPVPPEEFAVDAATNAVVFNTMPPDRARITATYRAAGDLPHTFKVGAAFVPEHLRVKVDGVPVTGFTADLANQAVTLAEAPADGAAIEIAYETAASRILRYAAVDLGASPATVDAVDADTLEKIPVRLDGGDLVFLDQDVRDQRRVTALFTIAPPAAPFVLELPNAPVDGTLAIDATGADCAERAAVDGASVSFPCPAQTLEKLAVAYDYVAELRNTFTLPGTFAPDSAWRVVLDGQEFTDFTVDGSTVTIPKGAITSDAVVSVEVSEPQHLP